MKLSSIMLYFLAFSLCQFDVQAKHSHSQHKHRTTRQIVKNIEKIDMEILDTVNNIQNTDNQILSKVNNIQATDNQILDVVTSLQESQKCDFLISAADIGTTVMSFPNQGLIA